MRVCWTLSWAMRSVLPMLSAMFIEVALNCSTAPAMLVISPDCCSIPSQAPEDIPDNAWARLLTCSAAARMCSTMLASASPIWLKLCASWPISSLLDTRRRACRSPPPRACACCSRSPSGRRRRRNSHRVAATASSIANRLPMARRVPTLQVTARISAFGMLATTVQGPPANGTATLNSSSTPSCQKRPSPAVNPASACAAWLSGRTPAGGTSQCCLSSSRASEPVWPMRKRPRLANWAFCASV
ncbi:hypothetical protein D9M71_272540 [compost metagenome]